MLALLLGGTMDPGACRMQAGHALQDADHVLRLEGAGEGSKVAKCLAGEPIDGGLNDLGSARMYHPQHAQGDARQLAHLANLGAAPGIGLIRPLLLPDQCQPLCWLLQGAQSRKTLGANQAIAHTVRALTAYMYETKEQHVWS